MKRHRDDARIQRLAAHYESGGRPDRGVGALNKAHCDRRAYARAEPAGCDGADRRAVGRENLRSLPRGRASVRTQADSLASRPFRQRAPNALGPWKPALDPTSLLNRPAERRLHGIDRLVELVAIEAKTGFKSE